MQKIRRLTLGILLMFMLSMFAGAMLCFGTVLQSRAEGSADKMMHWAPTNGDYSMGALLEGRGGEGMCMEFDLYETNFRDPSHLSNPDSYRVGFEYAKSNMQYFDIAGNDLQNCVQFLPDNTFKVVHAGGNPTVPAAGDIIGDPALFMVAGYRYRVEVRGGSAVSLANYFVASRRPISESDADFEQIVAFELAGVVADRGSVDPTYAGMVTKSGLTMNLDNIYIGRAVEATENCIIQTFDDADLAFDEGYEVHDEDGWSGINQYNPSWKAMVGNYGDLNIFYWIDTTNLAVNETEYNLVAAPAYDVQVRFMYNGESVKTVKTYEGGVVTAPAAPTGYVWDLDGVDLTNVTASCDIQAVADPDYEGNPINKALQWNIGTNVNAFGALLDGSTGSCVEFDLYDSNFWSLDDGSIDGLSPAERMYKPQITFAYGRSALRVVEIFGSNIQNVIQFFPNGEFNDVTHDGNPVAINPELINGDPALFMQPGYSYRVEMRTGEASELPNSFVVSRKEIPAPASYYEKILSFDLIASQFARGEAAQTYVAVETRGGVTMTLDNIAISRSVDSSVVKRADFDDGVFDQGTPCSELPNYANAGSTVVADGYEGKFGEISVFYWGNAYYTPSERKFVDMPFEHTLTFRVDGQEDMIFKVYDGAVFTGPKETGYVYTWDTESAGIDLNNITKSAVITGTKSVAEHTLTFIPGRGTGTIEPLKVQYGGEVTLDGSGFSREGYTLSGWATSSTGSKEYEPNAKIVVTSDMTLYALWQKNSYTVTFKDGDTVLATITADHGTYAEYPEADPVKEGYVFKGWDFDLDNTPITADTVVNAQFEKEGGAEKGGCSSSVLSVSGTVCALLLAAGAVAVVYKRKKA